MIFETSKIQQNEVDQETIQALTSRVDKLNDKSAHLAKLEKCRGLSERLDLAKQWRARIKDILAKASNKLENSAILATNVATDFSEVLDVMEKVSAQIKDLSGFLENTLRKLEQLTKPAKFYKLTSERRGRTAKD